MPKIFAYIRVDLIDLSQDLWRNLCCFEVAGQMTLTTYVWATELSLY